MPIFLGQIELFPYNFAPKGWMTSAGQLLPINQNQALFSLLGNSYGGDGQTNFALPNLKGKEPAPHLQYCIAVTTGEYPQRP